MCGIYGKVRLDGADAAIADAERACAALRHRGPDDAGQYAVGPACLGHVRLSIIDLSPLGHQPMTNEDGSLWIVFNGEIYNFQDLRPALEAKGHVFRSRTDTEVVLHLFEEEGPGCVEKLKGMFAFAIWNAKERTLFLARDRVGKKPLFYHHGERAFAFCSELAPLMADPEIPRDVDEIALSHFLTYQSVPAPFSAYQSVRKLQPGHTLTLARGTATSRRYWKLAFNPKHPADTPARRARLGDELLHRLDVAVRSRLMSDVPLGALLSGGVDSSAVVALMARANPGNPVRTFSAGFREREYNELPFADRVARQYRTAHTELTVRPEALSVLPKLVEHFGEPFGDSSAIPTYCVTRAAREHVKVALCGDGGDESFAGYERYKLSAIWNRVGFVPRGLWERVFRLISPIPHRASPHSPVWIAKRLVQNLALDPGIRALRFCSHFDERQKTELYTPEFTQRTAAARSDEVYLDRFRESDADDPLDATLYAEIHTYLPDTLLPKVDVTSMANSLEMRSPLLDHELMEFAARLPPNLKLHRLTTKYALKEVLAPLLPKEILHRPKRGFGVPIDQWFRAELRELLWDTLLSKRALDRGYFREASVRRILTEQAENRWQWHHHLYDLLMLELWHRRFIDR